ncbi:MAG TPA: bifunctional 2-polyprenyl-6-hydroxyphenol methylase/3-demethylubiquinol 3-O-methyltransferase UbiG [Gammaproteobacteria bacterium]|jgi:2-polyprenyl-6-hydroxyphenyl methylase/3-demethylubiquinone-9 3-methyltransferase|nr:bifunctional 2-polyprenyl-6-hydroxyphenol methylase/3-demethylubiquinol 3-O-methyltransferase UbiG [Gammaproteobacteria bacterium]
MSVHANLDADEIAKFDAIAARWWDPGGEFKPLHAINPLRLDYVDRCAPLAGRMVLDIGCGGGLMAEGMASRGAKVTGIDLSEGALKVAKLHLKESGRQVEYLHISAEALAAERPGAFDVVTCLEMLEHVPDPGSVIRACATMLKPGGQVVFSTLNRTPKAFALAILGGEYLLRLIPPGTHEYAKFIRPSELDAWAREAGLALRHSTGLHYNPLTRGYRMGPGLDVNYFMHFTKAA